MQFDVIIGNPPYQLDERRLRHERSADLPAVRGASEGARAALPVDGHSRRAGWPVARGWTSSASRCSPTSACAQLVDYPKLDEVFPGVRFKGGVCYFLWDRGHQRAVRGHDDSRMAKSSASQSRATSTSTTCSFATTRRCRSCEKVLSARSEPSLEQRVSAVTSRSACARTSRASTEKRASGKIALYCIRSGSATSATSSARQSPRTQICIDKWKVLVPQAVQGTRRRRCRHQVLGKPFIAEPGTVCTRDLSRCSAVSTPRSEAESLAVVPAHAVCSLPRLAAQDHSSTPRATSTPSCRLQTGTETWTDDDALREIRPHEGRDRVHRDSMIRPDGPRAMRR